MNMAQFLFNENILKGEMSGLQQHHLTVADVSNIAHRCGEVLRKWNTSTAI